jgi:hypothetical protein
MRIAGSGRFVFIAQWVAAVVLPAFFFLGRGLVGAELGWLGIIGIVYGVIIIVVMLIPPIVTLFDREGRRARSTRLFYDIATFVLWGAILVASLTAPDSGDSGHLRSALSVWTGMSYEASEAIFTVFGIVAVVAFLAQLVTALASAVRGARAVARTA